MPQVGSKYFSYSKKGVKAAKTFAKSRGWDVSKLKVGKTLRFEDGSSVTRTKTGLKKKASRY